MTGQLDKLNRTDLIKLIGEQVLKDLATEVGKAEEAMNRAQAEFQKVAVGEARVQNNGLLISMATVAGVPDVASGIVLTRLYINEAIPDAVQVLLADNSNTYDQRVKITVLVPVVGELLLRASQVITTMMALDSARKRDKKVSTIREKVRKDLVGELLKGPGGAEVLSAAKDLARAVKLKLEGESVEE